MEGLLETFQMKFNMDDGITSNATTSSSSSSLLWLSSGVDTSEALSGFAIMMLRILLKEQKLNL